MIGPGTRLGPYLVVSALGSGGMAEVFLAEATEAAHVPAGTRVALKVLRRELVESSEVVARFEREARAGAAVRHPGVVRTRGSGRATVGDLDRHFLVLDLFEGRSLRELLAREGRLDEPAVVGLGRRLAGALVAVHDAGLVHRDVKPENILLSPSGEAALSDLGLARIREEEVLLTRTGQFLGSLLYASPEQIRGGRGVGPASDLYSLGVVLLESLTGRNPFQSDDVRIVIRRHLEDVPPRSGLVVPEVSHFLEELLARLLAKEATARFPSASDLATVLEEGEDSAWWRSARSALARDSIAEAVRLARARSPVRGVPAASAAEEPDEPTTRRTRDPARALGRVVGQSERTETIRRKLLAFASFPDRHVLVTGPPGTGKSLFALSLHEMTFGARAPLVVVDAMGIATPAPEPNALRASFRELPEAVGRAAGGSILVEGVEDLPAEVQPLLAALLERARPGGPGRVMATMGLDPRDPDVAHRLRTDVYHRLRGLAVALPPLAERAEDLVPLAEHFLRELRRERGAGPTALDEGAGAWLRAREWPGNVRELRQTVEGAALEAGLLASTLSAGHLEATTDPA